MRLAFAVALVACGHGAGSIDSEFGAACTSNQSCAHHCFTGPDFPGGFCSAACASDRDCPADTNCVDLGGGVCMFTCPAFDCTRLSPAWGCHQENDLTGGKVSVCSAN